jgi:hypothetical protein
LSKKKIAENTVHVVGDQAQARNIQIILFERIFNASGRGRRACPRSVRAE